MSLTAGKQKQDYYRRDAETPRQIHFAFMFVGHVPHDLIKKTTSSIFLSLRLCVSAVIFTAITYAQGLPVAELG